MKDRKIQILLIVAFLLLVIVTGSIGCNRPAPETGPVEVGQAAPEFKLQDLAGHEVSLNQFKGGLVILDFWQTTCPPCRYTMPMLDQLQEEYSGKLSVLAINLDEPKELVRNYILEQNLNSRVLLGDWSVGDRYGTIAIPMQFLIDREGIVRNIMTGAHPIQQMRAEINKLL